MSSSHSTQLSNRVTDRRCRVFFRVINCKQQLNGSQSDSVTISDGGVFENLHSEVCFYHIKLLLNHPLSVVEPESSESAAGASHFHQFLRQLWMKAPEAARFFVNLVSKFKGSRNPTTAKKTLCAGVMTRRNKLSKAIAGLIATIVRVTSKTWYQNVFLKNLWYNLEIRPLSNANRYPTIIDTANRLRVQFVAQVSLL